MIPPKDLNKNYTFDILFFENKYGNDWCRCRIILKY